MAAPHEHLTGMGEECQCEDGIGGEMHHVEGERLQRHHKERQERRHQSRHDEGQEDDHLLEENLWGTPPHGRAQC